MSWKVRSPNKMVVLGIVLIIIFFVILLLFPYFMSFSPSKAELLIFILLTVFPLELGLFSIFEVKVIQAVAVFLVLVL